MTKLEISRLFRLLQPLNMSCITDVALVVKEDKSSDVMLLQSLNMPVILDTLLVLNVDKSMFVRLRNASKFDR